MVLKNMSEVLTPTKNPKSIVCPHCKEETGKFLDILINTFIDEDFHCPLCNKVVFEAKPEKKSYSYTGYTKVTGATGKAWTTEDWMSGGESD